ncbi:hypothetical protein AMECASPLE_003837, partial [Ameca splendens]
GLNVASVSRKPYIGTEPRQAPVKLVLEDGESHILTTLNETPVISSFPDTPQAEKTTEAEVSYLSTWTQLQIKKTENCINCINICIKYT